MSRLTAFSLAAVVALGIAGVSAVGVAATAITANAPVADDATNTFTVSDSSVVTPVEPRTPAPTSDAIDGGLRPLRDGDVLVTPSELRDYALATSWGRTDAKNAAAWIAEATIDVQCMSDKGFYYDPRTLGAQSIDASSDAGIALWGNTGGDDAYRWQDAGCHGLAVHETGNDDNH